MRSQLGQRDQKGTQRASELDNQESCFVDNLSSIIGAFVEHNRYIFGAAQHSIIGRFSSIIRLALAVVSKCLIRLGYHKLVFH